MKRLALLWLVCAAAGFAVAVVTALALSITIDHGPFKPPSFMELRPVPQSAAAPPRDVGHDRLLAG